MKWISTRKAAEILGLSERTIQRYAASGAISASRFGRGHWRVQLPDGANNALPEASRDDKIRQIRQTRQLENNRLTNAQTRHVDLDFSRNLLSQSKRDPRFLL